jgi:malonate transporter and related proteins
VIDNSLLATFSFAVSITAPIFLVLVLGIALKRLAIINDEFIKASSRLVFNIGLPVMLFNSCASADFSQIADTRLLIAGGLMTFAVFFLSHFTAHWHIQDVRDRGVFVQGAFRGNLVILGLALCAKAYGPAGVAMASLPVAMTVVIYNALSVYTLNTSLATNTEYAGRKIAKDIAKNPLIIGIALGLIANGFQFHAPGVLQDSANYLGQMVLPLALICIGGALDLRQLHSSKDGALAASIWKLVASPVIACGIALALGVHGQSLAVLFLLAASPTATVSFAMVQAMNGNAKLAANIIVQTTVFSLVTMTAGLWLLQVSGWV